ncbi:zonular occludens toxin domain-containing protein [Xanthomonas arboricola]|uniref:zonular occludens toxin domain-containing protein n=1 Tax=Xanthomonas arboricola TaxID=56448 RepID=UPI00118C5273|nr:zonular occludens toxin domain-containing protein [Xanthomonas arboricola]QDS16169.1 hypothetical protein FPL04_11340 [Xanthomonas arboricola]
MMYLISGQPGNGKSLRAMALMEEFYQRNQDAVKEGKQQPRRFFTNVAGATQEENPDAFPWVERLPDHSDWTQLPDGSFVMYDEAHSDGKTPGLERYGLLFPSTGKPGESEDPRIRAMSTHRHRGVDLVFITQWPSKIHHQVRPLIGTHIHMNRAMGLQRAGMLTWSRVQPDPYDERQREKAEEEIWAFPKGLYQRYKSSSLHTDSHKFRVPKKIWGALSMLLVGILVAWLLWAFVFKPKTPPKEEGAEAAAQALAPLGAGGPQRALPDDPMEYMKEFQPRVPSQPWSAHAYDDRKVRSEPELFCMSSEAGLGADGRHRPGGCTCVTEQGTRYRLTGVQCRSIARDGPSYNPYKAPSSPQAAPQQQPPQAPQQSQQAHVQGAVVTKNARSQGTFPESPGYQSESYTPQTTLDM